MMASQGTPVTDSTATPVGQANEVLCKVLAHNVVVVGQAAIELGIAPRFPAQLAG
jgi:hypothetical protein